MNNAVGRIKHKSYACNKSESIFRRISSFAVLSVLLLQIFLIPLPIQAKVRGVLVSSSIVISQAYGGGGGSTGTYLNDYVELKNIAATPQSLNGLSIMYGSTNGQFGSNGNIFALPDIMLQPGQYYLIQTGSAGSGGAAFPVTPDATTSGLSMSGTSGKVALTNGLTPNTCGATATPCSLPNAQIVDLVSWGTANNAEGGAATNGGSALTSTKGNVRKGAGCTETDNNNNDFDIITAPVPRNSSSTLNVCGGGGGQTNPTGIGAANPPSVNAGGATLLTVTVTPGTNPASTDLTVSGNLTAIGGIAAQTFFDDETNGDVTSGDNVFSYNATVSAGTSGGNKNLPVSISDAQTRTGSTSITVNVQAPAGPVDHIVISQVYGGGGNSGAIYQNDFVELYNPTAATVSLSGWSLQYSSATGTSWGNKQPIGGTIGTGQYYLVKLASGDAVGAVLPDANIDGDINLSGTAGKIALVNNSNTLPDGCPLSSSNLVDLVGYGTTANCREGTSPAPAPSNTTADIRRSGGAQDTNENGNDFLTGTPNPRRTAPIVEVGPAVLTTDPFSNSTTAPRDSSLTINFTEPVFVYPNWFDITCAVTGNHNSATQAGSSKVYVITPNQNFQAGETCTATIFKDFVHDQDMDDAESGTDTLQSNFVWSFTIATGYPPPYSSDVHLTMGNPTNATADVNQPTNYLMQKPEFALSYNRDKGTPNWVSWHLDTSWTGSLMRVDTFRPDPEVPSDWYRVQATDYFGSGFDRGHMTPNADRDNQNSRPINQATFLMSNMVPQAPDNNQGPWAKLENDLRLLLATNEIYIVSGGAGTGGIGSANGSVVNTIAGGKVNVPGYTWKSALIIPNGTGDLLRVNNDTQIISVIMPNTQGIGNDQWQKYLATTDQIEALTGYDLFSNVPVGIQNVIESRLDSANNTSPTTVAGGTYPDLNITAPNTTLGGNITVNGNLTLGGSQLNTGNFKITLGPNATVSRISGYVIGNLEKQFASSSDVFEYPVGTPNGYSPVNVALTALGQTPSSLTIKAVEGVQPNVTSPAVSLKRYWTLTETGDLTANLTFNYLDADVPDGVLENTLTLQRYEGTFTPIPANINTVANTAEAVGINTFSDWVLVSPLGPTAAPVTVGGRITSSYGRGIFGATVLMTDQSGQIFTARTNPFGYYRFYDVAAGNTYVVDIRHKQFSFAPKVVSIANDFEELNFTSLP